MSLLPNIGFGGLYALKIILENDKEKDIVSHLIIGTIPNEIKKGCIEKWILNTQSIGSFVEKKKFNDSHLDLIKKEWAKLFNTYMDKLIKQKSHNKDLDFNIFYEINRFIEAGYSDGKELFDFFNTINQIEIKDLKKIMQNIDLSDQNLAVIASTLKKYDLNSLIENIKKNLIKSIEISKGQETMASFEKLSKIYKDMSSQNSLCSWEELSEYQLDTPKEIQNTVQTPQKSLEWLEQLQDFIIKIPNSYAEIKTESENIVLIVDFFREFGKTSSLERALRQEGIQLKKILSKKNGEPCQTLYIYPHPTLKLEPSCLDKISCSFNKYYSILNESEFLEILKPNLIGLRLTNTIFSIKADTKQNAKPHLAIISSNVAELNAVESTLKAVGLETQFKMPILIVYPQKFHGINGKVLRKLYKKNLAEFTQELERINVSIKVSDHSIFSSSVNRKEATSEPIINVYEGQIAK